MSQGITMRLHMDLKPRGKVSIVLVTTFRCASGLVAINEGGFKPVKRGVMHIYYYTQ